MSGWPAVTLGEIAQPKQWPTLSMAEMVTTGFPVYGANGRIGYTDHFTHERPTILIGCRGSCGTVHITEPMSYANGNAMALDALDESRVNIHFLARFLAHRGFRDVTTGTSQPQIIRQNLVRVLVPLPPLPEQRRIAEILDKADALRAKRCAALDQLDTLTQSIFLDMFGNPATNPKGWPVDPLGDLMSEVYRYPTYYGIRYVEKGVPEIRGELLNEDGTIVTDATALRYISPETSKRFPRTVLAEGDLVMSVRGTVGKTAVVPAALAGANMTANLLRLAPDRNRAHPTYVWHFMQTEWFRSQLANACSNTTIQTIKAPDLKRIGVIRPPIDYQRDFNRILSFIQAQKTVMTAGMAGLDSLFVSTQHRAFRGEL